MKVTTSVLGCAAEVAARNGGGRRKRAGQERAVRDLFCLSCILGNKVCFLALPSLCQVFLALSRRIFHLCVCCILVTC